VTQRRALPILLGTLIAGLVVAIAPISPNSAVAAPRNPSDSQIGKAKENKSEKATAVGKLQAEVAEMAGQIQRLGDAAELAGERYNKSVADYQTAAHAATIAQAKVNTAQRRVNTARKAVGAFARDSYIYGSTMGPSLALLDSTGPSDFIERAGLLQAAGEKRTGALGQYQLASVEKSNADSSARAAVTKMAKAKAVAAGAKRAAEAKVTTAREQMGTLTTRKTQLEGELVEAKAQLSGLLNARQVYLTWKHHQEVLAAQRAARLAAERRAAERRAALLLQQQQQQQQEQQQSPPDQQQQSTVDPVQYQPPPPVSGGWSAAKGQAAVAAAERWLGTPYAWSGGTPSGPSYGTPPDEGVLGFDCSGLALYAWAQEGIGLPHYSGYQYNMGSHPSMSNLLPGDLLFWSYDGTPSTIHHVAIYIGNNQVIEAPESGDVIKIVPIWYDGLVGATRPGT
jgi:cell wall-associated NlpC family hydrolase